MANSSWRKYFNDGEAPEDWPAPGADTPPHPEPSSLPQPVVEPLSDVARLIAISMAMGRSGTPHAQSLIHHNCGRRWRRIG
ncbi:hypothetical protein ACIBF5_00535 [Micromonospora sp. NPDC050417]|uniref:hypothetical protein n=1 Tax=Micromonospora sp. NPDC050417 TaxID=3364280 RepID=UPI0037A96284